jgi:hypothetical protein
MRLGIKFAILLVAAFTIATDAAENTVFDEISGHYEAIRQALIKNTTDDIAAQAEAIAVAATSLADAFSVEAAGVGAGDTAAVKALLPEVYARAEKLAAADGLADTRQEFAALTQPLARWQKLVKGPRPIVAYCPMEKKAWLQPDEAIGNPYAPSMLRCGEVVQK